MEKLKSIISSKYNLNIVNVEKNGESTDGNVYMIYTEYRKYVTKIYKNLKHVASIINLHNNLIDNEIWAPSIICTNDEESYVKYGDEYIVVYSFLEGVQVGDVYKNIPASVSFEIGKKLRIIHNITTEGKIYDFNNVPFEIDENIKRCSVLHFDLTRSNIFCDKNLENVIGFIDFDDAKYGPSICDVSIAIANLYFSKTRGADLEGMNAFIEGYYGNDEELKNQELKNIKRCAISWIEHIMDGNEFDTSTVESFEVRKELMEKYFDLD